MNSDELPINTGMPTLKLFNPMNIVIFLIFYSPIIVASMITSLSFIFQNFKGFIYLGFLIAGCIVRSFFYTLAGKSVFYEKKDKDVCDIVEYSKNGNSSFSSFVFAFTLFYLSVPMFANKTYNNGVFIGLTIYFIMDVLFKRYKKCYDNNSDGELFFNALSGALLAIMCTSFMYMGGSSNQLFFNEISSTKEICTQPKEQTFKCQVYKNGELLGDYAGS